MNTNTMMYWERALTLVQVGILACGLEPKKSKEELLLNLGTQLPELGVGPGSMYQERAMLFYAVDDLVVKGLLRRDPVDPASVYRTSEIGKLALRRFRDMQESVRRILGNSPIGY